MSKTIGEKIEEHIKSNPLKEFRFNSFVGAGYECGECGEHCATFEILCHHTELEHPEKAKQIGL